MPHLHNPGVAGHTIVIGPCNTPVAFDARGYAEVDAETAEHASLAPGYAVLAAHPDSPVPTGVDGTQEPVQDGPDGTGEGAAAPGDVEVQTEVNRGVKSGRASKH